MRQRQKRLGIPMGKGILNLSQGLLRMPHRIFTALKETEPSNTWFLVAEFYFDDKWK